MLLDDSGSMKGQPWFELKQEFEIFMDRLVKVDDLKNNSWVTVINYNDTAEEMFAEKTPNKDLISEIKYRNGLTDFNKPLIEAHKICINSQNEYDIIIFYFMSDGFSDFPSEGIDLLLNEKSLIDKIEFNSIAYGAGADK